VTGTNGISWVGLESNGGFCERSNENLGYTEMESLLTSRVKIRFLKKIPFYGIIVRGRVPNPHTHTHTQKHTYNDVSNQQDATNSLY
jgi:hypothetical protein